MRIKGTTTTKDVPYCDCFKVEEEWYFASPGGPNSNSCVFIISFNMMFLKYTIMKTIIVKQNGDTTTDFWEWWREEIKAQNLEFKEVAKPVNTPKSVKNSEGGGEGDGENEDYTTEKELKELASKFTLPTDHLVYFEINLGLSIDEFYSNYLEEGGPYDL